MIYSTRRARRAKYVVALKTALLSFSLVMSKSSNVCKNSVVFKIFLYFKRTDDVDLQIKRTINKLNN